LVVWPETAITARTDQVAPFLAGLRDAARAAGATVIVGIIDSERFGQDARYFNAALATGASAGSYRKRRLVPLTEFLPSFMPEDWRKQKISEAVAIFSPGDDVQPPVTVAGVTIRTTICYETAYGRLVRDDSGAASILLSLTNDDWFMGTSMPAQDHQVARMRALESGREMLRVANSGITAWIAADGRVAAELPIRQPATLFAAMRPRTGLTPYARWGEWMWIVPVLFGLLLIPLRHMRLRQGKRKQG
jgi:apolipoprotein N-acyltransferase